MHPGPRQPFFDLIWSALTAAGVALLFRLALAFFIGPSGWPAVENPPKQGEAMVFENGAAFYSPSALARTIREPQATWSSFIFVAAAAWIFQRCREPLMRALAVPLVALALGAAFYHASGTREWRHLDIAGLYWVYAMLGWIAARELVSARRAAWMSRHPGLVCCALAAFAAALTAARNVRLSDFKPFHVSIVTAALGILGGVALLVHGARSRDARRWNLGAAAVAARGRSSPANRRPAGKPALQSRWPLSSARVVARARRGFRRARGRGLRGGGRDSAGREHITCAARRWIGRAPRSDRSPR